MKKLPLSIEILDKTTRFDLFLKVSDGSFSKELQINKESAGLAERIITALNETLSEIPHE